MACSSSSSWPTRSARLGLPKTRRAGAADQCDRVAEQCECPVYRQDRHADRRTGSRLFHAVQPLWARCRLKRPRPAASRNLRAQREHQPNTTSEALATALPGRAAGAGGRDHPLPLRGASGARWHSPRGPERGCIRARSGLKCSRHRFCRPMRWQRMACFARQAGRMVLLRAAGCLSVRLQSRCSRPCTTLNGEPRFCHSLAPLALGRAVRRAAARKKKKRPSQRFRANRAIRSSKSSPAITPKRWPRWPPKEAGLPANLRMATGPEFGATVSKAIVVRPAVAAETTVFGRIAPEQKEQIVAFAHSAGALCGHDGRWGERRPRAQDIPWAVGVKRWRFPVASAWTTIVAPQGRSSSLRCGRSTLPRSSRRPDGSDQGKGERCRVTLLVRLVACWARRWPRRRGCRFLRQPCRMPTRRLASWRSAALWPAPRARSRS